MSIIALILGWVMIGTASAFILAATFFDIKEKNLEENEDDL
jgi:C4-dicarboxylate transporter